MKKLLLSIFALTLFGFQAIAQTGACNTFENTTGLGEWDPNDKVSYSVAGGELTIVFTDAAFWGQNEVKWDFPTVLNFTGLTTVPVNFDISVTSVTINGGAGAGCGSINYIPLGISLYDNATTYSTGSYAGGYWDANFVATSPVNITLSPANAASIQGISIKPASFNDGTNNCNTDAGAGGTGTITATIKIKNLKVGTATCSTPTSVKNISEVIAESKIYPNPSSESSMVSLTLKNGSQVKVVLSDLMGKQIKTIAEGNYSELNEVINTKELKAGTYTVSYIIDGAFAKSELLVVK